MQGTHNAQTETGRIPRRLPPQIHIGTHDRTQAPHRTRDRQRNVPLAVTFCIVTDPSEITGVAQLAAGTNEDTPQVSRADIFRIDGKGEDKDQAE